MIIVASATGIWFAIDRGARDSAAADAAATPHAQSDSVANQPVGERLREAAPVALEHSRLAVEPDVPRAGSPSAPAPVESCRIRGRVIEAGGDPIAELSVWLVRADGDVKDRYLAPFDQPSQVSTTDVRGAFVFSDVATGAWLVGPAPARSFTSTPDDQGVAPFATLVELRVGAETLDIEILAQRGLVIRGRVLRPDGTPTLSAVVSARSHDAAGVCFAPTRGDGTFTLGPIVSGQYELWADSNDEGTTSAVVLAFAGDEGAELRLREGGSLTGHVFDSRPGSTGKVALSAMRQDIEPHEILNVDTDVGGRFHFDNVAAGTYQVVAQTQDGWFAIRAGVDIAGGGATSEVELELREGGRLRLERASRDPVSVELRQDDVRVFSSPIEERINHIAVPSGRITIRWSVGSQAAREQQVEIAPGAEKQIVLRD